MGLTRAERQAIQATIPPADVSRLKRDMDKLRTKTFKRYYRKATRQSQKVHILPFIRRNTPDGSGRKSHGKRISSAGLRQRGGNNLSAGTYFNRKSTGKLRRDFKVKAMKRSRKITGNSTVNFQKTIFYGRLLEMGRTWNLFKPQREWDKVDPARKKQLWQEGRWMWLNTAKRRGRVAERAVVRYMSEWIKADDNANKQQRS